MLDEDILDRRARTAPLTLWVDMIPGLAAIIPAISPGPLPVLRAGKSAGFVQHPRDDPDGTRLKPLVRNPQLSSIDIRSVVLPSRSDSKRLALRTFVVGRLADAGRLWIEPGR